MNIMRELVIAELLRSGESVHLVTRYEKTSNALLLQELLRVKYEQGYSDAKTIYTTPLAEWSSYSNWPSDNR